MNYLDDSGSANVVITPKAVSVTPNAATKVYGNADPTLSGTLSGFVEADGITANYSRTAGENVGSYMISATLSPTSALSNYAITYNTANFSITKAGLTITANNFSRQYSDANPTFTFTYSGFVNGETPASLGGTVVYSTPATSTSAPGTYVITPSGLTSGNYAITFVNGTLTVTQEDARATYTGLLYVTTSSASTSTASVLLSATIQDITATADAAGDTAYGDIRNATVTFINRDTGAILAANVPVGLVTAGDTKTGTAVANWTTDIGNADSASYNIGIIVNGYYTRNASAEDAVVTVKKPTAGSIGGGGYLVNSASTGSYAGATGAKTNFGLNVKYNKSGTNLQGNVNIISRAADGRVYQFKSNAIDSLTITTITGGYTATFTSKASVTDITNPLNPISLGGNKALQIQMTDKGEPGSSDTIAITLTDPNTGLLFSSQWNGVKSVEQLLGGGNLQVRPALEAASVGGPVGGVTALTAAQLAPIVTEAKARWAAAGLTAEQQQALNGLTVNIDNMQGGELGLESAGSITIDSDAAGNGWFVDSTPADDVEFATPGNQGEAGRYDLLSVVMHEMGHVLGYDHEAVGVMHEDLSIGVRETARGIPAISNVVTPVSTLNASAATDWLPTTSVANRNDQPAVTESKTAEEMMEEFVELTLAVPSTPASAYETAAIELHGAVVDSTIGPWMAGPGNDRS